MIKRLFLFILLVSSSVFTFAQDLEARVDLSYDRIQGVDPKVFSSLKKSLTEFLNNRKWTDDQLNPNEKIECNFFLNLIEKSGTDIFKANLTIQASRPTFNTSYKTPTVTFVDKEVVFRYNEAQTLEFSDQSVSGSDPLVSNLTAVFAYYIYLIVGLDYDSFSPKGGSMYLRRAQNVVNNAPEEGKSIRGWKVNEGNRNRYWLIDQLLSPKFETFRNYWYAYHRQGMDLMSKEPEKAIENIFGGISILTQLNQQNPSSILLNFFFNTKSEELANLLQQAPEKDRKALADQLIQLDIMNADKYRKVR